MEDYELGFNSLPITIVTRLKGVVGGNREEISRRKNEPKWMLECVLPLEAI